MNDLKSIFGCLSHSFYSMRKWFFRRYFGSIAGPFVLYIFSIVIFYIDHLIIKYLFSSPFPIFPKELRDNYFSNLPIIKGFLLSNWDIVLGSSLIITYILFEFYLFLIPRNPKGKISLGVAISMDKIKFKDLPEAIQKKRDILNELKENLKYDKLSKAFRVQEFNEYQSNKITDSIYQDKKYILKVLNKSRVKFIICGRPKRESFNGEEKYKHNYEYIVAHPNIQIIHSLRLSKDMRTTLKSQKWTFSVKDVGTMIEKAANNIEQDALFALGASSIVANHPNIGITLLEELRGKDDSILFKPKINKYLAVAYYSKSLNIASKQGDISMAITELEKSIALKNDQYNPYMLMSFLRFKNNEIDKAIEATNLAAKYSQDQTWRFNKAYLLFYSGNKKDIEVGLNIYNTISNKMISNISQSVFEEIIESFEEMIEEKRYQYFYGLIFVYYKLGKKSEAKETFNLFQEACSGGNLDYLIQETQKIISRIN